MTIMVIAFILGLIGFGTKSVGLAVFGLIIGFISLFAGLGVKSRKIE